MNVTVSTDMVKTISVDRMSDYSDAVEVVLQDRREAHWYDHWTIKASGWSL